ncbi:hypothetical protein CsSME_00000857 [Camellia sinensis var. sinensis]
MDTIREGNSMVRPPLLDGSNYPFWKARMRSFLKSIDEKVWQSVMNGWTEPTITVDGVTIPKPIDQWDTTDYQNSSWNSKAINSLFCAVTPEEFSRICNCEVAKEAWDILQTIHEGTPSVKRSKLQRLTSSFENLSMKDSETFDEFYAKLSDIVNSSFNLGEKIPESKVVGKILRSLPDRFQPKVTAIEEAQDVDNLKLDQLVGNLQTYEAHRNFKKKQKDIAFSSAHKVREDSDEDCDIDSKIIAAFVKQFKKSFLKKNPNLLESTHSHKSKGKDKLKINSIAKKEKGKIQGNSERLQCYECQGFGHFAQECPTRLKKKKALAITWDDESESDEDESDNEGQGEEGHKQFLAFMAASEAEGQTDSPKRSVENITDDESSESDHEELEQAYEKLYKESLKLFKLNDKLTKKLKACESENVKLKEEISEARINAIKVADDRQVLCAKLLTCETERNELLQTHAMYEEKIESLEMSQVALEELMIKKEEELKCAMATIGLWNRGSKTLEDIIGSQQMSCDKSGIGFGGKKEQKQIASSSYDTRTQGKGGQKIQQDERLLKLPRVGKVKEKKVHPVFICHHCGMHGHIRPYCYKLHGRVPQKGRDSTYMSRRNTKIHEGVHYTTTLTKTARPDFVKTKKIWVRKLDLC